MPAGYRKVSDLPALIPVFPLDGALLLPGCQLPLQIFEPRYLNMVDDAMRGHRLIGMIQTTGGDRARPNLVGVGCVGRVTAYAETGELIHPRFERRERTLTELPELPPSYEDARAFADDGASLAYPEAAFDPYGETGDFGEDEPPPAPGPPPPRRARRPRLASPPRPAK